MFRLSEETDVVKHLDDKSHDFIETLLVNNGVNGKILKNDDEAVTRCSASCAR